MHLFLEAQERFQCSCQAAIRSICTDNLITLHWFVISDHWLLLTMLSLIALNGTIDSDWRSGWHGQDETSVELYRFFFHTCTINYFEGDSYELTMESKSVIVFHYYANYAKKSSKIKSYWWYTALSSFSSDNSHLQPTEVRLLSIPLLTSFTFQGGSCSFFLKQLFWHTILRNCGIQSQKTTITSTVFTHFQGSV